MEVLELLTVHQRVGCNFYKKISFLQELQRINTQRSIEHTEGHLKPYSLSH